MTVDEAIAVFSSYSLKEKEEFLAHLMHELTTVARDSYEVGGNDLTNPQRVRRINEIQHRLSDFLLALLRDNPHRYPDEALVRIVLEHSGDSELEQQLNKTFTRLANQRLTVA
ncbi:MAG: hypothetical protein WBP93_14795 [Pyrinomonadaceae bacterium]